MPFSKRRQWWDVEAQKANEDIPDGLGIGVSEWRATNGDMFVFFKGDKPIRSSAWVVLGKFAKPRDDGKQFYVSDRTHGNWAAAPNVTYHEDLLMAVSWIMELKTQFEGR
ncbi:hypothetical protein EVB41_053 [Rhizobium phage RHph_TM3_14A]|nr:hypothetical protein EVB29_053 [Rhizobium phage RHph_TM27A]QIG66973.1 hypothetical protein EVB30_053 [Rhizobium phage RHph_TM27B]QIG67062.1 hypothetical protein EVB31_052 [Rhizobium phage RHph_TM29]QIG67518.1 hypothetical protein EVB41_053 [Rhizobium phage RHph_TM3_14A]